MNIKNKTMEELSNNEEFIKLAYSDTLSGPKSPEANDAIVVAYYWRKRFIEEQEMVKRLTAALQKVGK